MWQHISCYTTTCISLSLESPLYIVHLIDSMCHWHWGVAQWLMCWPRKLHWDFHVTNRPFLKSFHHSPHCTLTCSWSRQHIPFINPFVMGTSGRPLIGVTTFLPPPGACSPFTIHAHSYILNQSATILHCLKTGVLNHIPGHLPWSQPSNNS